MNAFEVRERQPGYRVEGIPIVIGYMGGEVGVMREQVGRSSSTVILTKYAERC